MKAEQALDQAMIKLYEICAVLDMGFKNDQAFLDDWDVVLAQAQALIESKRK